LLVEAKLKLSATIGTYIAMTLCASYCQRKDIRIRGRLKH